MRKLLLIVLFIQFAYSSAVAQFKWLNPVPSGYVNTKLIFINKDSGFLFNQGGDLFKTVNQAANWQLVQNFPNTNVMDLAFSTGVIAGWNNTLYISADNGQSWELKRTELIGNIKKVDIISRDTIIIVTDISKAYKSNNRGNSWVPVPVPPAPVRSVEFINSKLGFLSMNDGIYRTTDGGDSWQRVYTNNNSATVLTIKFYNTLIGFAYRDGSEMLKTIDGGSTWVSSYLGDDMNDIFIVNANIAYAVGELGAMYRTVNGGTNWTWMGAGPRTFAGDLFSQYFFNDSSGIVVGHRGLIMKTTNRGLNWQQFSPTYNDISDISFGTNNTGYAATWNNIYKTTDKGQTWNELPIYADTTYPINEHFEQCHFFNADTGIVFRQGWSSSPIHIYKTKDGGQTWALTNTFPYLHFTTGLSFINNTTGYANFSDLSTANQFGIYKTTDAGDNWQLVNNSQKLLKIQFVNAQAGFGTWYKKLYKTNDGANTWQEILENPYGDVTDFYFINQNKGFAIANLGYLKMTTDGGLTWTPVGPTNSYDHFIAIKFFDDKAGYVTTSTGGIYKTVDGGLTWNKYKEAPYYENRVIRFTKDSTVYIGGLYGTILSNTISEFDIDSLKADPVSSCGATFSAKIRADFSRVDSIWFEYGKTDFSNRVTGSPSNVNNSNAISIAQVTNLDQATFYKLRVRLLYKGVYYYSSPVYFNTGTLPDPVITGNTTTLYSSAYNGNQWFLNGQPVTGATGQQYIPVASGIYKVQVDQNGCLSRFSNEINFVYTGDTTFKDQPSIFPNPAKDVFYIKNTSLLNLEISVVDVYGRIVLSTVSANGLITIPISHLPSSYYFVTVKDKLSKEKISRKIFKL